MIANRLSKNSRVLLLEAGGNPPWPTNIPLFALEMLKRPEINWQYKTVPQRFSQFGMYNNQSLWPRGKVLGGSSVLNYMLYVRSHPMDYDNWANLTGDPGWKYENLVKYFKRSLVYNGQFKENGKLVFNNFAS